MTYLINEIFYSIQGEGYWSGRPAVFVRFARCNLWTGREEDRTTAICNFCDTDFVKANHRFQTAETLVKVVRAECGDLANMVVLTGGEPTLQVDEELTTALRNEGFYIAIETNGTQPLKGTVDWVCVSPKTKKLAITSGNELKLVYPQQNVQPEDFQHLRANHEWSLPGFDHFWLSPMDGGASSHPATKAAFDYCLANPQWRLNTQLHKTIGVR